MDKFDPRMTVGSFFENKLANLFGLVKLRADALTVCPDLYSPQFGFYVESKGAEYYNGGVINKKQLLAFQDIKERRFFGFGYHPFKKIYELFPNAEEFQMALEEQWMYLFIFPYSVVNAHFEKSNKRVHTLHDTFVQLTGNKAKRIYNKNPAEWERLSLDNSLYRPKEIHHKVFIMTREGHLEKELTESFNPELI